MNRLAACALAAMLPLTGCVRQTTLDTAKTARAEGDVSTLATALTVYESLAHRFPSSEQGLQSLVARPTTGPLPAAWTQQLSELPLDPWGEAYRYVQPGVHNPTAFDIYSAGPDKRPGTEDDIGNWQK
ncbi:MAG TPA: type II secretion system major pseudopilin GspG [Chthoniobacteraceae bacterium]|jgi:general secretion pathway protein G|nr:type II secretion system major pseudopilin GspG [Chthoniobacteraceae bacterium]